MAFRRRADDGPTLNAGLVVLLVLGDPDQYCYETLYFCDFRKGVPDPFAHWHDSLNLMLDTGLIIYHDSGHFCLS